MERKKKKKRKTSNRDAMLLLISTKIGRVTMYRINNNNYRRGAGYLSTNAFIEITPGPNALWRESSERRGGGKSPAKIIELHRVDG